MSAKTTILDMNRFDPSTASSLDEHKRDMVRRRAALGNGYRLFYRDPVEIVRGTGSHVFDEQGNDYLDAYNNVVSVGHCHPHVVEAISRQAALLNTHTRYLHETILDYSERLLAKLPEDIDRITYQCTGSEANDLAIRIARNYTGGRGIIVTNEAYHGNTDLVSGFSPSIGMGQELSPDCGLLPTPDTHLHGDEAIGDYMAAKLNEQIALMEARGVKFAGLLVDSIFSSDGIFPGKPGWLKKVADAAHAAGGLYIADEVQPGFCRTGDAFWGFERHGFVPDIVTMGKPMANGIACSATAVRHDILDAFTARIPYFNTFAGNPVAMAAASATLDVMENEDLMGNARRIGAMFVSQLEGLAVEHPCIADIRGAGLYIGVDFDDPATGDPMSVETLELIEHMRRRRVLTSNCGSFGNILKIRTPLVFSAADVDRYMTALADSLDALGL
ncbi:aspartate aminotransferase family protein [Bifidobacterium choloepi]|uniref:Aspartate aminotransferase family protein n=1 Tax=Bifidobacterium choloepi TaxID=2614131 RepID=A0A6I5N2X7_9BIFI|nr:aspartate aminotransferase family protein [Bifidobacterium choloepi]NEG70535.1 aspartate aminotransferase family protein [Bifidobacterium choloepi]